MPAFNAEPWIGEAIESIVCQTFTDWELLIVNDGSTDGTDAVLASFDDRRLRILEQENRGVALALNRGLQEATGDLVARMDADDISYPERLARQVDYLDRHQRLAVVGSSYRNVRADGTSNEVRVLQRPFDVRRDLHVRCPIGHPTVMYRRDAVLAVGGYRPEWQPAEDWDLWWRLRAHGIANLPDILLDHRDRPASAARNGNLDDQMRQRIWAEDNLPWPWPWQLASGLRAEWAKGPKFYLWRVKAVEVARMEHR